LVQDLLSQNASVTVLDLPKADWARLPSSVKKVKADILSKKQLEGSFKGVEIVYHLAARTDIDGKTLDDYKVNFDGTKNVIDEASKVPSLKRFVFYSTQLVVGLFNETRFIDESEPFRTKTAYGHSKIAGEKVVTKICGNKKIPFTIIRPTSVYGPWGEAPYREFFKAIKEKNTSMLGKLVIW